MDERHGGIERVPGRYPRDRDRTGGDGDSRYDSMGPVCIED